jgi:hypothetical protein
MTAWASLEAWHDATRPRCGTRTARHLLVLHVFVVRSSITVGCVGVSYWSMVVPAAERQRGETLVVVCAPTPVRAVGWSATK